jgi:ascorbate-specific PTS system EIIC-type component UlaA
MILIEAHVRDKLNIAPVSKKFKDVAKLAMQRIENEIAQNEGKAIYKDYAMIIRSYLTPVLGNLSVEQIKLKKWVKFLNVAPYLITMLRLSVYLMKPYCTAI